MNTKKKRTSVDLTPLAQKIKDHHIYLGLKSILSAGLVLFEKQTTLDKHLAIQAANDKVDILKLPMGAPRRDRIKKAIAKIENEKRFACDNKQHDLENFCNELLDVLTEPDEQSITTTYAESTNIAEQLLDKLRQHFENLQMEPGGQKILYSPAEISKIFSDFRQHLPHPEKAKRKTKTEIG